MSESALWGRMRAGMQDACFMQRIENTVGAGMPDVLLHSRVTGKEAWVELKYRPERPDRIDTPLFKGSYGLRPEQKAWIYERALVGVNVWILAQCANDLFLIHGREARILDMMSERSIIKVCDWRANARATRWNEMARRLVEHVERSNDVIQGPRSGPAGMEG